VTADDFSEKYLYTCHVNFETRTNTKTGVVTDLQGVLQNKRCDVRFEVLTAACMKITVFWVIE
jgi:hypothetical protein